MSNPPEYTPVEPSKTCSSGMVDYCCHTKLNGNGFVWLSLFLLVANQSSTSSSECYFWVMIALVLIGGGRVVLNVTAGKLDVVMWSSAVL